MRLADDALGLGDGFLHAFLAHGFGAGAGFVDEGLGFDFRFVENFAVAFLGFGKLLFDFLGVLLRLGNAATALGEDIDDRTEGEFVEHPVDENEKNALGDELRPRDTEGAQQICDNVHVFGKGRPRPPERPRPLRLTGPRRRGSGRKWR